MRLCQVVPLVLSSVALAQSFTVQNSNTTENLRGLSAVSSSVIWASGTHGTYLRTVNGGATWSAAQVPGAETLDFRDLEAFSADEAYLLAAGPGDQSRIYKTADAGKAWTLQFTNGDPKGFYDCMSFGIALTALRSVIRLRAYLKSSAPTTACTGVPCQARRVRAH